jgi:hypothetical protein
MDAAKNLYRTTFNPLLIQPANPLPDEIAVIGAGTTGPDIGKFPQMLGDSEAAAQYARDCVKVQTFMDQMSKPVVAAVNGSNRGEFDLVLIPG